MRTSPSIVPRDETVYLVEDDLGRLGRVWREADSEETDLETVLSDLLSGQYKDPLRVIAFNVGEGWSRDVSEDVARELRRRCDLAGLKIPAPMAEFIGRHDGQNVR
jgi:hypothetical protein